MRKLLHTRHGIGRRQIDKASSYCYSTYTCLKWLLCCFSLTCYFFDSFLITHDPPPPSTHHKSLSHLLSTTTSLSHSSTTTSRALFQSLNLNTGLFKDLKVFVYNLPSKYNTDWLSNDRCANHLFASEVAIHRALLNSEVRTFDPWEADFFFVPVYVSCNFTTVNGFPSIAHARSLISSAVQLISSDFPFWNRSRGSDHVFVASHDFGACFHTMVSQ